MTKQGFRFKKFIAPSKDPFEKLFDIFKELITFTSGDVDETFNWLEELDKEYQLTDDDYTLEDFKNDLQKKGFIQSDDGESNDSFQITAKTERIIRKNALAQIFGQLKRKGRGNHRTSYIGAGDENSGDTRAYQFGDTLDQVDMGQSIKNAQINHGIHDFQINHEDLVINQSHHNAQMSTVLMIDISHSMILYGEDRITPAKKVAMALAELIMTRYPKDSLDIIAVSYTHLTLPTTPYV